MHWGAIPNDAAGYKNLYTVVVTAFSNPLYVGFYLLSLVVLAYHLWHGFQSGFRSLGLSHPKYTPILGNIGKIFAVIIPLGFAAQPIILYLKSIGAL